MIQRIQTVFYFLAFIFFTLTALFTVIERVGKDAETGQVIEKVQMRVFGVNYERTAPDEFKERQETLAIGSLTFAMAIFSILLIFQYKNRQVQLKIGSFVVIIGSALCVMIGVYASRTFGLMKTIPSETNYGLALVFPIIGVLFAFLGNKNVKKDEMLIKSVDRIR